MKYPKQRNKKTLPFITEASVFPEDDNSNFLGAVFLILCRLLSN